jgi:hypothetical protein
MPIALIIVPMIPPDAFGDGLAAASVASDMMSIPHSQIVAV